ncbi:hypothetical protein HaLaN_31530, partial [Haematococcus lacustris]
MTCAAWTSPLAAGLCFQQQATPATCPLAASMPAWRCWAMTPWRCMAASTALAATYRTCGCSAWPLAPGVDPSCS